MPIFNQADQVGRLSSSELTMRAMFLCRVVDENYAGEIQKRFGWIHA